MENETGPLFLEDELSSEQEDELRRLLTENPEAASDWADWQALRHELRARLDAQLPDRRLLVLYALDEEGRDDLLTSQDRRALGEARPQIAEAVSQFPVLEKIVERIQEERSAFETVWAQHQDVRAGARASVGEGRAERKERSPRQPSRSRQTALRPWAWRLTIATLLLGAAVLAVVYGPQSASRTTVTVDAGEQKVVEFSDGSTARLVGAAELSYPSGEDVTDRRSVQLDQGRAYFDVVHAASGSFVVNTPSASARVLGTQFGVTTGADTTEVILVDGAVEVGGTDAPGDPVVLAPGERTRVDRGRRPSSPSPVDVTAALDWTGMFIFRSTPLRQIAEQLEAHYDAEIRVSSKLADETVTATFDRDQPVEEVLKTLGQTLDAEIEEAEGAYRIAMPAR